MRIPIGGSSKRIYGLPVYCHFPGCSEYVAQTEIGDNQKVITICPKGHCIEISQDGIILQTKIVNPPPKKPQPKVHRQKFY